MNEKTRNKILELMTLRDKCYKLQDTAPTQRERNHYASEWRRYIKAIKEWETKVGKGAIINIERAALIRAAY